MRGEWRGERVLEAEGSKGSGWLCADGAGGMVARLGGGVMERDRGSGDGWVRGS